MGSKCRALGTPYTSVQTLGQLTVSALDDNLLDRHMAIGSLSRRC